MATNIERSVHHRFAHIPENIAIVSESVAKEPNLSIRRRSQELILSYDTLWRILHLDLHLYPYKVQISHSVDMLINKIVVSGVLRILK